MSKPVLVKNPPLMRHNPAFIPQGPSHPLLQAGQDIQIHRARSFQRWRTKTGRLEAVPPTQQLIAMAHADYIAQLMMHPARHTMRTAISDSRAVSATPLQLFNYATENRVWNENTAQYDMAAGKTVAADATPLECTWQHKGLGMLCNADGLQWMFVDCDGHTGFMVYLTDAEKWIWIESTFNEHYRWSKDSPDNYVALSPLELHEVAVRGALNEITVVQHSYQPNKVAQGQPGYISPYKVYSANNWKGMVLGLDGRTVDRQAPARLERVLPSGTGQAMFATQIAGGWIVDRDTEGLFAPQGTIHATSFTSTLDGTASLTLATKLPGVTTYQRRVNGGAWAACGPSDVYRLNVGDKVEYRGVNGVATTNYVTVVRN